MFLYSNCQVDMSSILSTNPDLLLSCLAKQPEALVHGPSCLCSPEERGNCSSRSQIELRPE